MSNFFGELIDVVLFWGVIYVFFKWMWGDAEFSLPLVMVTLVVLGAGIWVLYGISEIINWIKQKIK